MQAENSSQRSRGKYLRKPPDELGYLIEIVNCLPPDGVELRLMNPEALKANVEALVSLEGEAEKELVLDVRLDVAACESTRQLPPELRDYVWRGEWKGASFHAEPVVVQLDALADITGKKVTVTIPIPVIPNAFRRYAEVWDAYEKLHGLAKAVKDSSQRWRLMRLGRYAAIPAAVQLDTRGMVRERKSLFSRVIEGQSIEAARIRECPVCARIFWAGRLDAGQCGRSSCKSALSSRRNRDRDPELRETYNKARRKKRQRPKR
jgi:hypothetical protein